MVWMLKKAGPGKQLSRSSIVERREACARRIFAAMCRQLNLRDPDEDNSSGRPEVNLSRIKVSAR